MSTLQSRIKDRMKAVGINNAQLAAACKVKPPTSFNWASGKTKNIKGEPLLLAAKALGVTPEWLSTGKGPMEIRGYDYKSIEHAGTPCLTQPTSIKQALDALESALTNLDMTGRQMLAPLFESFARSPGAVVKNDIATLLAEGNIDGRHAA